MDNVFITGANGFLGTNLVEYFLRTEHKVVAVIRADGGKDNLVNLGCEIIEYDGSIHSLKKNLNEHTTVIHAASYYVAEHQEKDLHKLFNSNLQYGMNLLEAMRLSGANKILNIGTAWQGFQGQERRPVNLYAATKQAFEDFIAYYCDAEGFTAISLRLNDTYGEEDKRFKLIKLLINAGVTQTPLNMSGGEQKINLSHISDVCSAIDSSIKNLPKINSLEAYNLVSKDEYSLKELVKVIEIELNMTIPVNFGAKDYRKREVMEPLKIRQYKLYKPLADLRMVIQKIHSELYDR